MPRDGVAPADHREIAFIEIVEGRQVLCAVQPLDDRFGGVFAPLHRDLRDAGKRLAVRVLRGGEVADHVDLGKSGDGEIRVAP